MIAIFRTFVFGFTALGLASCDSADRPAPGVESSQTPVVSIASSVDSAAPAGPPRRVVIQGTDLTGIGYDVGSPDAKVVVVNFSDFGCPFCGTFARETYPALEREFVEPGKVFFKYVPFVMGMFPNAREASRAAECAADQGRFWEMHDRLYAGQPAWKRTFAPEEIFRQDAAAIQLDLARFNACYAGQQTDRRTAEATRRAEQLRVRATPSFFVNGRLIEGALPLEQFRMLLNEVTR